MSPFNQVMTFLATVLPFAALVLVLATVIVIVTCTGSIAGLVPLAAIIAAVRPQAAPKA